MRQDLRETALYKEAMALFAVIEQPGSGLIVDAAEVHAAPDGKSAVFAGTMAGELKGTPPTRICHIDLGTGDIRVLSFGPHTDRLPKYSPDGKCVAFLSDRRQAGDFQLYLLHMSTGAASPAAQVDGWIEYLHWLPDGRAILLGVTGHGSDVAGAQGATTSKKQGEELPGWMPVVEAGDEACRWRSVWLYEMDTGQARQVSRPGTNVWEAVWCGRDTIAAIVSAGPGEALWYSATLSIIPVRDGKERHLYRPGDQIGWPAASPSGRHLAVVEAVCSDRWIVAGDLLMINPGTAEVRRVDTGGVDVSYTEWRSDKQLLLAGHRGFETVVCLYDAAEDNITEIWSSADISGGGHHMAVAGLNETGDCVLVGEGFLQAPEIAVIRQGRYQPVKSLDHGYGQQVDGLAAVEKLVWSAPDGLEIQGWVLRPLAAAPYPVVMNIHGGPVWLYRPHWLGRRSLAVLMLLKRGYAIFYPNPRGSSGRGQVFARRVVGDMGGADTYDYLSGLDHLVKLGIADPKRLGVTGVSYGGYMSSWLITQDDRFAAAVSVAPVTNYVTEHLISNLSHWVASFLDDTYTNVGGRYYERSPIMHAQKARTPTLNICGALDCCTPPEEAVQFHNALLENGVQSVLVTYPEEGHSVRKLPAAFDYAARVVAWFEEHMPPSP